MENTLLAHGRTGQGRRPPSRGGFHRAEGRSPRRRRPRPDRARRRHSGRQPGGCRGRTAGRHDRQPPRPPDSDRRADPRHEPRRPRRCRPGRSGGRDPRGFRPPERPAHPENPRPPRGGGHHLRGAPQCDFGRRRPLPQGGERRHPAGRQGGDPFQPAIAAAMREGLAAAGCPPTGCSSWRTPPASRPRK